MEMNLNLYETRVIGSLIEKEITTPDQYPLSLNALISACNQKSNRDPVLDLDEAAVQQTVDDLVRKHLVSEKSGFGGRVCKYQHRFCNTEFGTLKLSEQELGVIGVLFLRGRQTPGDLRSRTQRLCKFRDVSEVEAVLEGLMRRDGGPYVARLAREPGKRESRYAHLFSGEVLSPDSSQEVRSRFAEPDTGNQRLRELERTVEELQQEVAELKAGLAQVLASSSESTGRER